MRRSRRNGQLRRTSSDLRGSHFADQDLFLVVRGLRDHHAERIGEERAAPELEARRAGRRLSWPTRFTAAT